ncbi:hypothetical protein ACVWWI_006596 [Bradyrhizobium sp. USDA 3686]|nr:hypothetical protein [Bradyrhizobium canariense]
MTDAMIAYLNNELEELKSAGLYKSERVITSVQSRISRLREGEWS